jgi:hypothetical protein
MTTMYDETKLPRWAQERLHELRGENDALLERLRHESETDAAFAPVQVHTDWVAGELVGFTERARVRFSVGADTVECVIRGNVLEVRCFHGHLAVRPEAGNSVTIATA